MRLLCSLFLSAFGSFVLAGCSSADSSVADGSAARPDSAGGGGSPAQNSAGGARASAAGGGASIVAEGGKPSAAGGSSNATAGSVGTTVPTIVWNSAKSALVTDAELMTEYAAWKLTNVTQCDNGSFAVLKDAGTVVSEGIGYGMLLAVGMNDQSLFDGLSKYYFDHLDKNGLMNWTTGRCDAPGNDNSNAATDGDLDTTMALVQAAARWSNADYLAKAQGLAAKIAQYETDMCSGRRVLKPGDVWGGCTNTNDQRINPSYFSPGYYKVFAHYFPEQASTWTALTDGTYQLYTVYQTRLDDLVPDWSNADGSDNGSGYSYDACRTPFRVAVDYAWTGDTRAKTFMQNISTWVDAHGGLPSAAQAQNSAFVGAFALAGGYEQSKFDGYMSAWLGAKLDDTPYYQGTLRVLYLLVAAGKFSSTL